MDFMYSLDFSKPKYTLFHEDHERISSGCFRQLTAEGFRQRPVCGARAAARSLSELIRWFLYLSPALPESSKAPGPPDLTSQRQRLL